MTFVFDATPLIYLAKADRLGVVRSLDRRRLVPNPVSREVVTDGIEAGCDDARRIERAIDDGVLETVAVDVEESPTAARLARHPGFCDADVSVLACAEARDAVAVMDEAAGRSAADVEGVETRGTAYLVLSAVQNGRLSPEAGRETIDAMVECGWYVAPDLYARIVRKLELFE